jgi:hypothetical protein
MELYCYYVNHVKGCTAKFTIEVSIANIPLLYGISRPSGEVNTTSWHMSSRSSQEVGHQGRKCLF